ncbi:hypothetical protein L0663_19945 [Dyadobacter sp. CY107]|uniref:hypothetical protein n=1 Tax=Dyadobacter fanqingshengii TaxID=2906443 RepID=UPI001F24060C|nr:hypothetical protein [Dyadobacter fanqingshengii]MCF2505677.1 hypothetical protein [Dyadobacter fanqingshengii]
MRKNYISFALLMMFSVSLLQCRIKDQIEPDPDERFEHVDFDKGAIQIMDTLVDHLYGRWKMQEVEFVIKYANPTGSVKKDTIFKDFAELEIKNISRDEDPRNPVCSGELLLQGKVWPVAFRLNAAAERIVDRTGPQAFTLFETNFPNGSRPWKDDELFFRDLGLTGENYSIEIDYKSQSMIWKGLNRDIKHIKLTRP